MPVIEYFYSAHSAFAYLGSARFMEIAKAAGRRIDHRPNDLRRVVQECGAIAFPARTAAHVAYFFGREIERWSEERQAPVMDGTPTYHSNDIRLPNCMLIAGLLDGQNVDALAHGMLESHWRDDADLADEDTLAHIATATGYQPAPLLDQALSDEVMKVYEKNTEEAIARSVFGSPTYFVDGDMFYGQDRLEIMERALHTPYQGTWPRD
jgi:2-hydroxychromene-2-carboxylate isomerase